MNIGPVSIGPGQPCRFVAELGNASNGNFDRCLRLIEAAKDAGADLVKFQCYTPDELVALRGDGPAPEPWGSQGWTMRTLYEKAQTPHAWFPKLAAYCNALRMPWFSSVFGPQSLALLESLNCPAYKVARLDNQANELLDATGATGKPMIVSATTSGEVVRAQARHHARALYCPPGYPQARFAFEDRLSPSSEWGMYAPPEFDGFSYHGTDPLPCIVAATLGAKLIECHMQLDNEPSELEANVSLTASQFAQMVQQVRRVEEMLA